MVTGCMPLHYALRPPEPSGSGTRMETKPFFGCFTAKGRAMLASARWRGSATEAETGAEAQPQHLELPRVPAHTELQDG